MPKKAKFRASGGGQVTSVARAAELFQLSCTILRDFNEIQGSDNLLPFMAAVVQSRTNPRNLRV